MQHLRFISGIIIVLIISFFLSGFYSLNIDPEVIFWTKTATSNIEYTNLLDTQSRKKIIFIGGSSCAFSINPEQLKTEFNLSAVNFCLHVSAGRNLTVDLALQHLHSGDTLVIAFETSEFITNQPIKPTSLGNKIWWSLRQRDLVKKTFLEKVNLDSEYPWINIRPGLKHISIMMGKILLDRPLYRYSMEDVHSGGYITTNYSEGRLIPEGKLPEPYHLAKNKAQFLKNLRDYCNKMDVSVAVSLPWLYTNQSVAEINQSLNQQLVTEISNILPVLEDWHLGVSTEENMFADTTSHLSKLGAKLRTSIIGHDLLSLKQFS